MQGRAGNPDAEMLFQSWRSTQLWQNLRCLIFSIYFQQIFYEKVGNNIQKMELEILKLLRNSFLKSKKTQAKPRGRRKN